MFWKDLSWTVNIRKPTSIPELKLFCTDEWAKIPDVKDTLPVPDPETFNCSCCYKKCYELIDYFPQ